MSSQEFLLAFPADQRLSENSALLVARLESGDPAPQTELCLAVANDFAEQVLKAMLLDYLESDGISPLNRKVLLQLAKVVNKTTKFMINKVVAKLSNEEMLPLAQYIDKTRVELTREDNNVTMITCPLSEEDKALFDQIKQQSQKGAGAAERENVARFIQQMSDATLHHFMWEPTQLMKLGVVSRKLVETSYHGIRKGTSTAIKKVIVNMGEAEVANFVAETEPKIIADPRLEAA